MKLANIQRSGKQSLYGTFLALTLVPLLLFGLVFTIYSAMTLRKNMLLQVVDELRSAAESVLITYDAMIPGDYHVVIDENKTPLLYKGGVMLSGDDATLDLFREKLNVEISIFFYDNRLLTTIANSDGEKYVNTGANAHIMDEVYRKAQPQFFDNVRIGTDLYFAYYQPIFASDRTVCLGMIGIARNEAALRSTLNRVVYRYIAIVIAALLITTAFVLRFTSKLVLVLQKIIQFMRDMAGGFFYRQPDPVVMNRTDELGELGHSMVKVQTALRRQIEWDALTGIFNRRSGEKRMDELRKNGKSFVIAMGDIDFFKNFNDNYGHECGDEVLKQVAKVLNDAMRKQGFVSRWGGEEFLLVFEDFTAVTASVRVNEILQEIRDKRVHYNGKEHSVTMTFGIAEEPADGTIADQINAADAKLYEGKKAGRNRVVM